MNAKLLHLHAQDYWHDNAYLVGNRAALRLLQEAIATALGARQPARLEVMAADGEGYTAFVILNDDDWLAPTWERAALPYTDEAARESRADALWPWTLMGLQPAIVAVDAPRPLPHEDSRTIRVALEALETAFPALRDPPPTTEEAFVAVACARLRELLQRAGIEDETPEAPTTDDD